MNETLAQLLTEEDMVKALTKLKPGHTALWAYWKMFLDRRALFNRPTSTAKSVRDALRFIIRNSPLVSIEDCNDKSLLENTLLQLKESRDFSGSTYNTYGKTLNTYFIWLKAHGIIKENNVAKIEKFKEVIKPQPAQKSEEVERILLHLNIRRQRTLERARNIFFYRLLILTGARPSEIEQMTTSSVKKEGENWVILVPGTKNKPKPRAYRMPSSVRDAYITYELFRERINRKEKHLFISLSKRTGWTQKGMRALFKSLSKELGFPIGLYRHRRFVVQTLAENNVPLNKISDHFGHTRGSTTRRYLQDSPILTEMGTSIMEDMMEKKYKNKKTDFDKDSEEENNTDQL